MFKILDNLHSSFSNYTNSKCTYFFANETTFAILATYLWPLTVVVIEIIEQTIYLGPELQCLLKVKVDLN